MLKFEKYKLIIRFTKNKKYDKISEKTKKRGSWNAIRSEISLLLATRKKNHFVKVKFCKLRGVNDINFILE